MRAVMTLTLAPEYIETPTMQKRFRDKQLTPHIGKRVDQNDIDNQVKLLFPTHATVLNE